ncbi:MAG: penicillin-binding protein activator [Vibrionaceae bacterium]
MRKQKINNKLCKITAAIALVIAISNGCSHQGGYSYNAEPITSAARYSPNYYLERAAESQDLGQKADWYLLATKAYIQENQFNEASNLILRLGKMQLSTLQLSEWQLNRAEVLTRRGNPQSALSGLSFAPEWQLPEPQWQRYFTLQANLYKQQGDLSNTMIAYANLGRYAPTNSQQRLSDEIWSLLEQMSPAELNALASIKRPEIAKWLTLHSMVKKGYTAQQKQQQIDSWRAQNGDHFAARYLPIALQNLKDSAPKPITTASKIGVLLPLSNQFASQGETVRNGLLQAMLNDPSASKPDFIFYDTNSKPMAQLVKQMQQEGVGLVVGPLEKNKVEEFIVQNQGRLQNLALNAPKKELIDSGSCFFTLSPEQEAQQAAVQIAKRHRYALVIAPRNGLGQRVSHAFSSKWKALAGQEPSVEFFDSTASMQKTVENSLGLASSKKRISQLESLLDLKLESEARSRRDIDAIYLFADAGELTLLKPFIEVAINPSATAPKLYASSRANNLVRGGAAQTNDLNGITFSDAPPLILRSVSQQAQYQQWPTADNNLARLYLLGMDAYKLVNVLPQMQSTPQYHVQGQLGSLYLEPPCLVQRELQWGQFTSNGINPVGTTN